VASAQGHVEVVKALLLHKEVDLNLQRNTDDVMALWMAQL
jgi:hypothetical protein